MAGGVVFRAIYISKDPPRIGAFAGLFPSVGSASSTLSGGLLIPRITTASNLSNSRLFPQGLGDLGAGVTAFYPQALPEGTGAPFFPVGRPCSSLLPDAL